MYETLSRESKEQEQQVWLDTLLAYLVDAAHLVPGSALLAICKAAIAMAEEQQREPPANGYADEDEF